MDTDAQEVAQELAAGRGAAAVLSRRLVHVAVALSVLLALTFPYFAVTLFEDLPPIWPDEALFASPALELIENGRFGTPLLGGVVPGIGEHTYWVPPLHLLYLAAFFAALGPGVVAARMSSLVAAVAVLALAWAVSRRAGLGRSAACLPPALLAADHVFLQGALVARMDMLCLALVLLALWLWLAPERSPRGSASAGLVAGLAVLTHPLGIVVVVALLGTETARRRWRHLLATVLGGLPAALAWGAYALVDLDAFTAQVGGQLARKSGASWAGGLEMSLAQHTLPLWTVAVLWVVGLAGLVLAVRRRPVVAPLLVTQVLLLLVVVPSGEIWYPLYLLPLAGIGVATLVDGARTPGARRLALGGGAALGAALFASANVARSFEVREQLQEHAEATDYGRYARAIDRALPPGARVLLATIPDPWFELRRRDDVELRAFVPDRLAVDAAALERHHAACTHVVVSRTPPRRVEQLIRARGVVVAEIGDFRGAGYYAAVFRLR